MVLRFNLIEEGRVQLTCVRNATLCAMQITLKPIWRVRELKVSTNDDIATDVIANEDSDP